MPQICYRLLTVGIRQTGDSTSVDLSESLRLAATNGNAQITQLLLDHGVTVEDKVGALHAAANNTHAGVVDFLLNKQDRADLWEILSLASNPVP